MSRYVNEFPMPPSVNQIWRAFKGRTIKTREYREWIASVAAYKFQTACVALMGEVRATYRYGRPSKRRMDVCNREKGVSDILTAWGILQDDSQLVDVRLLWDPDVKPGHVRVELEEIA